MKFSKTSLLILFLTASFMSINAQSKTKSYTLKKGQAFDILFLGTKPETKEKLQNYFKTVFPVAEKVGYHSLPGYKIEETPTQGNYHPQAMILGYWDNLQGRKEFLKKIEEVMPDFHQERRNIWSSFNLTYYELKEDLSFDINPEKFNIVTAYWKKDNSSIKKFKQEWVQNVKNTGGQIRLELMDGNSPFGYYHNPDYLVITEWKDKAAFNKFYTKNLEMNHSSIKHVNQFQIK
ncbi:hypothetical protein [Aquimarina sediminis]|uniref:hypothetical protein n=1 Tax=Aquimarina sediminis TaxID=2070536 RepID=UPI000FFEEF33|nr:hypothetical protein [Aquimarina sediminis]